MRDGRRHGGGRPWGGYIGSPPPSSPRDLRTGTESQGGQRGRSLPCQPSVFNTESAGLDHVEAAYAPWEGSPRRRLLEALSQQRGFSAPVHPQDGWPLPRVGVGRLFFPKSLRRVVRPRRKPRPTGAPARPVATVVQHPQPRAAGPSARRRSPDAIHSPVRGRH